MTDDKPILIADAADEPETDRQASVQSKGAAASAAKTKTVKSERIHGSNGLIWFVLLALIAALVAAAWFLFREHRHHQALLANLQGQISQQQTALANQKESLEADIDQQITQQQERVSKELAEVSDRLENANARLAALSTVNRDDWKLAEAAYLLRFADQRVLLDRSSSNAIALAQAADEILRHQNDADLHPLRRALSSEMGELRLAGDIDREGVYLRLNALSQQIDRLPLVQSLADNDDPWLLGEDESGATESIWAKIKRGANKLLHKFSHHLRVRDHTQPVPAILPPDSQVYLKQNMRLMLEQAQSAFLRDETQIYQASLEKADSWLNTYFPLTPQSVAVQAEITELQNVTPAQSLPTFAESTRLLKEYIERRNLRAVEQREGGE